MALRQEQVSYRDGAEALSGWVTWDDAGGARRPGVLVIHGGAGLDAHAKKQAARFAAEGVVALACDMFGEGVAGNRQRVMARIMALRGDRDALCRRARAGLAALA